MKKLINKAREKSINSGAKEILIGVRDESLLETLELLGFKKDYEAAIMELKDRSSSRETLKLISLSEKNKEEYLRVYNDSFNDMPHGASLDNEELKEYIDNDNDNEGKIFHMVNVNEENIGFFNCEIENEVGMFDIGLCKKHRGIGYGKLLLETAIEFLNNKEVKKISLIVIERNSVAYSLYKRRGFEKESVLSYWIVDKN